MISYDEPAIFSSLESIKPRFVAVSWQITERFVYAKQIERKEKITPVPLANWLICSAILERVAHFLTFAHQRKQRLK